MHVNLVGRAWLQWEPQEKEIEEMLNPNRFIMLAAASALAIFWALNSANADDQFDPTVDYRSLKEEFAAEDAGATYGDKRRSIRAPDGTVQRRRPARPRNFSTSASGTK